MVAEAHVGGRFIQVMNENNRKARRNPGFCKGSRLSPLNVVLVFALGVALGPHLAQNAAGDSFTNLYSFTRGSDGASPRCTLTLAGETLYGTASAGGVWDHGAVFAIKRDGTGFTNLYSFSATSAPYYTNSDGAYPYAGLLLIGNMLYGTTTVGGTFGYGNGAVFKINTNGSGFEVLHIFAGYPGDGADCYAPLVGSGDRLYGTTLDGGSANRGTVFAMNTDGKAFTILHSFEALSAGKNSEGANPYAGLVRSGNRLYGTAYYGGTGGSGSVFALNTDGSGFTNLHNFTAMSADYINTDGGYPHSGLILSGGTLYGATYFGGSSSNGTIFALSTNGTDFTTLYTFTVTGGPSVTNYDGARPFAELFLSGDTLFGMALRGGRDGWGTIFALSTAGTGFTLLHTFGGAYVASDAGFPEGGLIRSGDTLYGAAVVGGNSFYGSVFSYPLPRLTITRFPGFVSVTWPTNVPGLTLLSSPTLGPSAVWTSNPPPPILGGQYSVINLTTGAQKFYKLR